MHQPDNYIWSYAALVAGGDFFSLSLSLALRAGRKEGRRKYFSLFSLSLSLSLLSLSCNISYKKNKIKKTNKKRYIYL